MGSNTFLSTLHAPMDAFSGGILACRPGVEPIPAGDGRPAGRGRRIPPAPPCRPVHPSVLNAQLAEMHGSVSRFWQTYGKIARTVNRVGGAQSQHISAVMGHRNRL